ncbi:HAMP domain-containing protein, partial [Thermodesulfobacteriota bacterium]
MNLFKKIRRLVPLSINGRLFLLRIGIGLFIGLSVGVLSFWIAANIIQKQYQEHLTGDARLVARQIDSVVHRLGQRLSDAATSDRMEKYFHSGREVLLAELFRSFSGWFEKLAYTNTDGSETAVFVDGKFIPGKKPADQDSYRSLKKRPNFIVIDGPGFDEDLGKSALRFLYFSVDFFDNPLGIIEGVVRLETFGKHLDTMLPDKGYMVLIQDAGGRVIYGPESDDLGKPYAGGLSNVDFDYKSLSEGAYLGKHTVYGVPSLVAADGLPDPDWRIFLVKSTGSVKAPLYRLCAWIFFTTLCILFCGEVFSRTLKIRIIEPIARLRQVASAIIADGNLEKRVEWASGDEMGELAETFNLMLEKIEFMKGQVEKERQFVENIIASMTDLLIVLTSTGFITKINTNVCMLFGYEE